MIDKPALIENLKLFMKMNHLKNRAVEKTLHMPLNSLSNFLKLKKVLPDKWVIPIQEFTQGDGKVLTLAQVENIYLSTPPPPFQLQSLPPEGHYDGEKMKRIHFDEVGQYELITYENPKPWINAIEDFCMDEGIMPQDLIDTYNRWKQATSVRYVPNKREAAPVDTETDTKPAYNPNDNPIYRKKMNMK